MIRFSKVIAGNSDLLTAQAFVYQNPDLTLAFLVTASGEDVFTKVRLTAAAIEEQFFIDTDLVPAKLEKSFAIAKEQLKDYSDLQIEFFIWQENLLYISTHGNHHAYLLRDNQLTHLTPQDGHDQLISGHLKIGDRLLFISNSLNKLNDQNSLKNLALIPLEQFDDEINSRWRESSNLTESPDQTPLPTKEPIAAILVDYHGDQLEQKIPKVSESEPSSRKTISLANLVSLAIRLIPKNNIARLILIAVLVLLAAVPIALSIKTKSNQQKTNQINSLINSAKDKLNQARNLKDLDPSSAKQNLDEARKNIDQVLTTAPTNIEAQNVKKQIDDELPNILKIYNVTNFPVFLTLDLIKPGFQAKKLSSSLGRILLLDDSKKTLVLFDLTTKTNQILAGENQLGDAKAASLNGDFAFVYSQDKGILRVDTKAQKSSQVVKPDSEWGKILDIFGFGGNVYALDIIKNQIWKYIPAAASYSDKNPYFRDNKGIELASAKKMEIDSSIWILFSGNEIKKYTQGVEDNFSINGLDENLCSVNTFYVSDTTDHMYLLASANSRLVVLDKKGKYLSQYQGDKFKTSDDLVVDEKGKKIYLLEGNKIYQIDLR